MGSPELARQRVHRKRKKRKEATTRKERAGVYLRHRERLTGKGRLRQFVYYLTTVLELPKLAEEIIKDGRRSPTYSGSTCVLLTVLMVVMRYRSFNAFEKRLTEPAMKKWFGNRPIPKCIDTVTNALKKIDLTTLEELHQRILKIAADNKALRETLHDAGLRFFAFDGFEPIRSSNRSCAACLTATYEAKDGPTTQHFHRYVFTYTIGPQPQLLFGLEPLASVSIRQATMPDEIKAEGELTAVKRVIDRTRRTFPKMFDIGIGDGLYPNGPMFNFMKDGKPSYDLLAVLKKETDEPMADAVGLYETMAPTHYYYDEEREEHVQLWDTEGFQGLETSNHPLRVIKAQKVEGPENLKGLINWDADQVSTWWMSTTAFQEKLSGPHAFDAQRRRWDQEAVNNDFTQNWFIKHSYIHHEVATTAMMYIFMIAYNLFQLFLHRRLGEKTRKTYTNIALAKEMELDYPQITSCEEGFFPTPGA